MSDKKFKTSNFIDEAIAFFSPQAGLERIQARLRSQYIKETMRGYDGAANTRRTKNWRAGAGSVNAENHMALRTLRFRARDLVRNEAYAQRAKSAIDSNVIGAGIIATAKAKTDGRAQKFQDAWLRWAESTDCDYDGRNNFYGIQSLVTQCMFESGECLVRKIIPPSSANQEIPLQLQVLEPDFLDTLKDSLVLEDGGFIHQGVEFGPDGRRRAYWLFDRHPGELMIYAKNNLVSQRYDAKDVIHVFRTDRTGQVRGVPWLACAMIRMKDHSDWSDATLLRQKLAACFTAFVTDPESSDLVPNPTKSYSLNDKLEPGIVEILKPGQKIEFANPPMAADFGGFSKEQLRGISAGIGVTYEILTNDYSNVNFSSGRMGWIEFQRNIDKWRWQIIIPHLNNRVWGWFIQLGSVVGMGSDPVTAIWTPPRREMIDPGKEIEATKEAVRSGLMSLSEAIRQNGYEPAHVLKELSDDMKKVKSLGLTLDTDAANDNKPAQGSDNGSSLPPQ